MTYTWDFLDEFAAALKRQPESDQVRWGNTWLKRIPEGQETRIEEHIKSYFDQFRNAGQPVPWLKVAGLAMIAWIRDNHRELWDLDTAPPVVE